VKAATAAAAGGGAGSSILDWRPAALAFLGATATATVRLGVGPGAVTVGRGHDGLNAEPRLEWKT
jgi:hypothetical protein